MTPEELIARQEQGMSDTIVCAKCHKEIETKQGSQWRGDLHGNWYHVGCCDMTAPESNADFVARMRVEWRDLYDKYQPHPRICEALHDTLVRLSAATKQLAQAEALIKGVSRVMKADHRNPDHVELWAAMDELHELWAAYESASNA